MTNEEIQRMRNELQKLKLQKEIERYQERKNITKEPEGKMENKMKEEIEELEAKKKILPGGFRGFLQSRNIQYAINQRRKFLRDKQEVLNLKLRTEMEKEKAEVIKTKTALQELRKRNTISFDDLYKLPGGVKI